MNTKFFRIAMLLTVVALGLVHPARSQEIWTTGEYAYDGAGSIVQMGADRYLYDKANRLASATVSGTSETYHYDSFGNLTGIDRSGQPQPFPAVSPQTNRFLGEQYDGAGNMETNGSSSYAWDALNMLAELNTAAGVQKRFIYTADDERIGVIASSSLSRWTVRDFDGKVLREFRADGANEWTWDEDYAYSGGKLVGAERPPTTGGVLHFHVDHLGTPRLITNAAALKLGRHDYYPFGVEQTAFNQEVAQHNQERPEQMRFTGHQRDFHGDLFTDKADYLDYMLARYYSPALARFLSVDPVLDMKRALREPQSWNRYSYVVSNPINRIDPDGRRDKLIVLSSMGFNDSSPSDKNIGRAASDSGRTPEVIRRATKDEIVSGAGSVDRSGTDVLVIASHTFDNGRAGNHDAIATWQLINWGTLSATELVDAIGDGKPAAIVLFGCSTAGMAQDVAAATGVPTMGTTGDFNQLQGFSDFEQVIADVLAGRDGELSDGTSYRIYEEVDLPPMP